jgi:hypothetical protein
MKSASCILAHATDLSLSLFDTRPVSTFLSHPPQPHQFPVQRLQEPRACRWPSAVSACGSDSFLAKRGWAAAGAAKRAVHSGAQIGHDRAGGPEVRARRRCCRRRRACRCARGRSCRPPARGRLEASRRSPPACGCWRVSLVRRPPLCERTHYPSRWRS